MSVKLLSEHHLEFSSIKGGCLFVCLFVCVCYAFVRVCLFVPCGHRLERADLLALVCSV